MQIFGDGLTVFGPYFAYAAHFVNFETCLDSNSDSCRRKEARYQSISIQQTQPLTSYQFSHSTPYHYLAIHHHLKLATPIPQLSRKLSKLFCCFR